MTIETREEDIKISIIVPIYNVEEYLEECLESLAKQTLSDIEIIMVNDGSTDSSPEIAKGFEDRFTNFHLYNKPNGGLGQARNYGIPFAKGEYIAFVDSDDYMPENAYEKLYQLGNKNHCDIVTGNVVRFNSKKQYPSKLHSQGEFNITKEKTTLVETPELIYDVTSWNKIYKRTFWIKNNLSFPEGIIYEDIPATIPAHYLSTSTAILSDVIYYWRERDGLTKSLSQQNHNIVNFLDRLKVLKMVDKFFEMHVVEKNLIEIKNYRWLTLDFPLFVNILDQVDSTYQQEVVNNLKAYIENMPEEAFKNISPLERMKYFYIMQGDIKNLLKVIEYSKIKGLNNTPVIKRNGKFYPKVPFDIPREKIEMSDYIHVSKINRKINSVKWEGNVLKIRGYGFKSHISMASKNKIDIKAFAVDNKTSKKFPLSIEKEKRKDVTFKTGGEITNRFLMKRINNYNWCGFQIDVNVEKLEPASYRIEVEVNNGGYVYSFIVGGPVKGKKTRPSYHTVDTNKVSPSYNAGWDFNLNIEKLDSLITSYKIENNRLFVFGWTNFKPSESKFSLNEWNHRIFKNIPLLPLRDKEQLEYLNDYPEETNPFYTILNVSDFELRSADWYGNIRYKGVRSNLVMSSSIKDAVINNNQNEIRITKSKQGNINIKFSNIRNYLYNIKRAENDLILDVRASKKIFKRIKHIKYTQLITKNRENGYQKYFPSEMLSSDKDNLKMTFKIPLLDNDLDNIFSSGVWDFYVAYTFKSGNVHKKRIALEEVINFEEYQLGRQIIKPAISANKNFKLEVKQKWNWFENGPRRQGFIEKVIYPLLRLMPIKKNRIVFESYWGKSYSCNPRALYEYIDENHSNYKCIWCFQDDSLKINGNGIKVRVGSLKYYYYLATSKFFVNNVNFPEHYKKRENAIEIQTMHGTPLKTLGLDVADDFKKPGSREKFLDKCNRWDYLITPSDYVTDIGTRCFEFKKEVLQKGTPRNDYLIKNNTVDKINEIKAKLNIPKTKKVILYAPTWRVKNSFELMLDLEDMKKRLSDEYVLVLRLHHFAVSTLHGSIFNEFVLNGSDLDDIQDLYLISDILVTDYSSVMFDYAILNKPMLFFTYDYELYANNIRGFYMDFEKEAPTPLLKTSEEVCNAILEIENVIKDSEARITQFKEKYCQYETGQASESIFNEVIVRHS